MGARFEALDEGVLAAASKSTGYFLPFQFPRKCGAASATGLEHAGHNSRRRGQQPRRSSLVSLQVQFLSGPFVESLLSI